MRCNTLLTPAGKHIAWSIMVIVIMVISIVPACSGGTEDNQEIDNVGQTDTQQTGEVGMDGKVPESLPPIDENTAAEFETATFASG